MAESNTIKTSIQGIEITLLFGPLAIDLVASELKRLEDHDPDSYLKNAEQLTTPLVVFCGYYNHCQVFDIPVLFTFEDFCKWTNGRMALHEGRQEVAQIYSLYIKSDPFLCQDLA
jgi:hypothetical protein